MSFLLVAAELDDPHVPLITPAPPRDIVPAVELYVPRLATPLLMANAPLTVMAPLNVLVPPLPSNVRLL